MSQVVEVTGGDALLGALSDAVGGEIFVLLPGDYSGLDFAGSTVSMERFESPVTLRAAEGTEVTLVDAVLAAAPGLVLENVRVVASEADLDGPEGSAPANPGGADADDPAEGPAMLALFVGAGGLEAVSPPGALIEVFDRDGLLAALAGATGGETILLAAGNYGTLRMTQDFDSIVTLRAAGPGGAVLNGLDVEWASGIAFEGLTFKHLYSSGNQTGANRFSVSDSSDITIRGCTFEGDINTSDHASDGGFATGKALKIVRGTDILVEDNEVHTFWKGVQISLSENVIFRGNEIHHIRSDGLNLGDSGFVLIENNHFHNFVKSAESGDHCDMIQMFGGMRRADGRTMAHDITITGNLLDMGDGGHTQSIFLTIPTQLGKVLDEDDYYRNITITENVIVNGQVNGITVSRTDGLVIANNTLLTPRDQTWTAPRINVLDSRSTNVVIENNIGTVTGTSGQTGWLVQNNFGVQHGNPYGAGYYNDVFVNALSDSTDALKNLQLLPGSAAAQAGAGASWLAYDGTPETLTALGRQKPGADLNVIAFDAGLSAGPAGRAALSGATFAWDFGDGTTGTGLQPLHYYADPGIYRAMLTVTLPDGSSDTSMVRVEIRGAELFSFDAGTGRFHAEAFGKQTDISGRLDIVAFDEAHAIRFLESQVMDLPPGVADALFDAEGFAFSTQMLGTEGGELACLRGVFKISVTGSGEIEAYVNASGQKLSLKTDGAHVTDGGWHDVTVSYDGSTGGAGFRILVDGAELAAGALSGNLARNATTKLTLGASKDAGFEGYLRALDIDVDPHRHADAPPAGLGAPELTLPAGIGDLAVTGLEAGIVTVAQADADQWHSISFDHQITDARVVMGPLSDNGGSPAFARVRNVTDQGFEFQIDEWDYLDGRHGTETLHWVAVSAGAHALEDGTRISAGRSTASDGATVTVDVAAMGARDGFAFAQVTSAEDRAAVLARVTGTGTDRFTFRMQEEEAADQRHGTESVDWIVFGPSKGGQAETGSVTLRHVWQNLPSPWELAEDEVMLAAIQSDRGRDTSGLRMRQSDGQVALAIEEEASADAELQHTKETVAVASLQDGFHELFSI